MPHDIDPAFAALPARRLAEVALTRAAELGQGSPDFAADFRLEQIRTQHVSMRDGRTEANVDGEDVGFAVRVVVDGTAVVMVPSRADFAPDPLPQASSFVA